MVQGEGRYIYGVVCGEGEVGLGPIGIDGSVVYIVSCRGFCAIVHNCTTAPYQSSDNETVKSWVKTHQGVLDKARERFGAVIPFGFDTILAPTDEATSPDQVVKDWLKGDHKRLQSIMEKIKGRDEYAVQIFYEPALIGKQVAEQNQEIRKITEEVATKSPGTAYMYKQRLEKVLKAEMENLANDWFKSFYGTIKQHCDDIAVEKTRKADRNKVMLLNLSCLVATEKVSGLGDDLEKINNIRGLAVHFSGPWPPYSFVAKPIVPAQGEIK